MAGLTDYTALKASIVDWFRRPDITAGSAIVDDWIDMAEAEFNATLRLRSQETQTDIAMSGGYVSHPTDWLGWKRLTLISSGRVLDLFPAPTEYLAVVGDNSPGEPQHYSVVGDRTYFNRTTNYTIRTIYHAKVPALDGTTTSNWLLAKYPQAYLYGALLQASGYYIDDGRVPLWKAAYDEALARLLNDSEKAKHGGQAPVARPRSAF